MKTPEIQVLPHQEVQHAGGLRPQQPVRRQELSVQGLESRSQSHLEIREDHQVRLQHHGPWPNVASNLDDLPLSIRQHLERASQLAEQDPSTTASLAAVFLAQYTEDNERRVLRSNDFETAPPP